MKMLQLDPHIKKLIDADMIDADMIDAANEQRNEQRVVCEFCGKDIPPQFRPKNWIASAWQRGHHATGDMVYISFCGRNSCERTRKKRLAEERKKSLSKAGRHSRDLSALPREHRRALSSFRVRLSEAMSLKNQDLAIQLAKELVPDRVGLSFLNNIPKRDHKAAWEWVARLQDAMEYAPARVAGILHEAWMLEWVFSFFDPDLDDQLVRND